MFSQNPRLVLTSVFVCKVFRTALELWKTSLLGGIRRVEHKYAQRCSVEWEFRGHVKLKGLLHPKMKILSLITYPMAFQTRKSFVRLRNTI